MTARPYVSIYVAIDTPDAPRLDGKTVRSVSWSAHRYPREGAPIEFVVTAHHPHADDAEGCLTTMLETKSLASPDLPDWVPRPPVGWLASLELDDHVAETQFPAAVDAMRAYLAREGRL